MNAGHAPSAVARAIRIRANFGSRSEAAGPPRPPKRGIQDRARRGSGGLERWRQFVGAGLDRLWDRHDRNRDDLRLTLNQSRRRRRAVSLEATRGAQPLRLRLTAAQPPISI